MDNFGGDLVIIAKNHEQLQRSFKDYSIKNIPTERQYYTFLKEASTGKDTMTGHWEMMGIHTTKPFKTFTETGFPQELIDELEKQCGKIL